MLRWILRGLRTGIVTTRYPGRPEPIPSAFRGAPRVDASALTSAVAERLAAICPTDALSCEPGDESVADASGARKGFTQARCTTLILDYGKCIFCGRCAEAEPTVVHMSTDYELASRTRASLQLRFVATTK